MTKLLLNKNFKKEKEKCIKMKKKITFIDILIILAVIIVFVLVLSGITRKNTNSTKTISYTVLTTGELPEVAQSMVPEDGVLLDTKENAYGRVTNVDIFPAESSNINLYSEKYVTGTIDEKKDVKITVEVEATEHDFGYTIGQQHIRVGEKQNITAPSYVATGYIIEVYE